MADKYAAARASGEFDRYGISANQRTPRTRIGVMLAGQGNDSMMGRRLYELEQAKQAEGLQSDSRMAEAYVRYRSQRGHGPKKIRSELLQKGVAGSVVSEALASTDTDWTQLARSQLEKRFGAWGEARNLDARSKAQRSRFLQQRGFDYEHISAAL